MKKEIPCKLSTYSKEDKSNLMKVKLYVMSDGKNYNGSSFTLESMMDAQETIKNTPILAYLEQDEDGNVVDFDGHNMETTLVKGENGYELKTIYQEQPIGVIPESCNPRYEEIDGKNFFVVDGYIWRPYTNGACELIEEHDFMNVSMEIEVCEGQYNDRANVYEINAYKYLGVTVLGENVLPAIAGSKIMKYSSSEVNNKTMLENIYKEIYRVESEVDKVEDIKKQVEEVIVEQEENEPVTITEEEIEATEDVVVEEETSVEEETVVEEITEETTEVEETTEEFKAEEDEEDEEFKKKRKCSVEDFSLDMFNVFFEEVPETLEEICSLLVDKFNALNEELTSLKEFKANYDKELLLNEVEEIVSEFSFEEGEIAELKENAIKGEISTKEFKKELFALEGMKFHNAKKEFSAQEEVKSNLKINVVDISEKHEPYGGLFSKYGINKKHN